MVWLPPCVTEFLCPSFLPFDPSCFLWKEKRDRSCASDLALRTPARKGLVCVHVWKAVPLRWKWDGRPEPLRESSCQGHCARLEVWTLINLGLSVGRITSTLSSLERRGGGGRDRGSVTRWIMEESIWETEGAYRFCWCGKRLFRYLQQAFVPD